MTRSAWADPDTGRPGAPEDRTSAEHEPHTADGARDLEVSRGSLLENQLLKRRVGDSSAKTSVLALEFLYDITSVQFYDLTAITKRRWIVEFCTKLIEKNLDLQWSLPAGTRSEVLDDEVLRLAKKSGCHYLVYAPESGSPETLKFIKKRITIDNIVESMRAAKKINLVLRANMIIDFPHEKRMEMYKTLLFGLRLTWMGVDEIPLFIFSAYPGIEIFDDLVDQGAITFGDPYFFGLASLNGKYSGIKPKTYNKYVPPLELAFYRLTFMTLYYAVGYLRFPKRIIRTIRNLFFFNSAATVFEHRLRDSILRVFSTNE